MANVQLSCDAAADLQNIADYTIQTFGVKQARRYRDGLRSTFVAIAENPDIGIDGAWLRRGVRRQFYQSHVIFYEATAEGILILRILHKSEDAPQHLG